VLTVKKAFTFLFILNLLFISHQPQMATAYSYHGPESELILLINAERAENGVPPLAINWEVMRVARYKSEEMKRHGLLSHESLVYGSPTQQLTRFQIPHSLVGANIAMGQETPQDVLEAWRNSRSHHSNLVNADYTSAGVGLSIDDGGIYYWTLMLVKEN